jgi:hypothetical protein
MQTKCYVATDNLKSDAYVAMSPGAVIDCVRTSGLAFNGATATGVTLHLLGALPGFGKMGLTCIENSVERADDLYREVVRVIDAGARRR